MMLNWNEYLQELATRIGEIGARLPRLSEDIGHSATPARKVTCWTAKSVN
jgi:hypothetical protein